MFYAHVNSCAMLEGGCRGLPGGNSLSFASPKESKQRKGDPQSGSLHCVTGNLRCSIPAAVQPTRFAQTSLARPSASICAARPSQDGVGREFGFGEPNALAFCGARPRSAVLAGLSSTGGDGSKFQMSEGCVADKFLKFPSHPSSARNRVAERSGPDCGSPFFWVLFFGEAKTKCLARRGETRLGSESTQHSNQRKASTSSARTVMCLMGSGGQA